MPRRLSGEIIHAVKLTFPTWSYERIGLHLASLHDRPVRYGENAISHTYRAWRKQQEAQHEE